MLVLRSAGFSTCVLIGFGLYCFATVLVSFCNVWMQSTIILTEKEPKAMPDKPHDLDAQAEAATQDYLRRRSITFLECAIDLMLTHMSLQDVIEILETQAKIIKEFD